MTKIYCDHCGKELNGMKDYICINLGSLTALCPTVDLCADCKKELAMQIIKFCGKKEGHK